MTDEVKSYTREECMPKFISPVGTRYMITRTDADLYEIHAAIEDDFGHLSPDLRHKRVIEGSFTGHAKAVAALVAWLTIQWDAAEVAKIKKMRPAERVALNAEQQAA